MSGLFWKALLAFMDTALGVAVGFHLRLVFGEQPWVERTHGERWPRYKVHVPRWFFGPRGNNREVTP